MGEEVPYGPDRKPWREDLSPWAVNGEKLLVSAPSRDPMKVYPHQRGTTPKFYQVPSKGLDDNQREQAQDETAKRTAVQTENFLGYQANMGGNYQVVSAFLSSSVNNLGDPFVPGNFTVNAKWMERNVLDYFASLWNAKWPHDPKDEDSYWGYVLTMGSSEGNLYGLWNARDYLQGKLMMTDVSKSSETRTYYVQPKADPRKPNAFTPVAFYSEDTHYSVVKAMAVMEIKTFYEVGTELYPNDCPLGTEWPEEVPSEGGEEGPGSIDISKLCKLVDFFAKRGYPPLIVLNCGTTFKGAYDNVKKAGELLMPILERYGLREREFIIWDDVDNDFVTVRRKGYWIHVDGALGASYMPFMRMAFDKLKTLAIDPKLVPPEPFDFQLPFVCSMITSGHKFPGAPWPCGIYMTKTGLQLLPPTGEEVEYIGSLDTTFAGSRNGLSSLVLWTYISTHNYDVQVDKVLRCLELSVYTEAQLKEVEAERKRKGWAPHELWVVRSSLAMSVRFRKPNDNIVYKYSLANETFTYQGEPRTYTHVYVMGFTTKEKLDELFHALRKRDAFEDKPVVQVQQRLEKKPYTPEKEKERLEAQKAGLLLETKKLFNWPRGGRGFR